MSNGSRKREIAYWIVAMVLFAAVMLIIWPNRKDSIKVQAIFFGNSIIGNVRDESSVPELVGKSLGISVYNAGFGGTCVGRIHYDSQRDYSDDTLSFSALVKAFVYHDFSAQQNIHPKLSSADYFEQNVDGLEKIDLESVQTVFIYYGVNDFFAAMPVENAENPFDEYSFAGAFRSALRNLRREYPSIRIVIISPAFFWEPVTKQRCTEYDNSGQGIEEYISAQKRIAEEFDVEYIDLFHGLFVHENDMDWYEYSFDGVHPNEYARTKIAEAISEYMKTTN